MTQTDSRIPPPGDEDTVSTTHNTAPTRFVEAGETTFAYRPFGAPGAIPVVFIQHFHGDLDNFDPAITDALAGSPEVILFDDAGVGSPTGTSPSTIAGMAADTARFLELAAARAEIADLRS